MTFLPWAIVIPLAGPAATVLLGRRLAPGIGLAAALATLVVAMGVARRVWLYGPQRHEVGGWGAPLGIDLVADGLSAVLLLMTAAVGLIVSCYALSYFRPTPDSRSWSQREAFWPLWLFLWGSLNILYLSGDIFNIYIGLELMGLSAVALIILAGGADSLTAGLRYFLAALLGSLAYLFGVALLYAAHGTLDLRLLGERVEAGTLATAPMVLMIVGLLLKTALFPLHFWLPAAHATAPAPVSAALSALVVKASFYLVLRLWFDVFPNAATGAAAQLIGAMAAGAILWGSLQAIRQRRLKLVIAYSTVAQIGYLFLVIPLTATQLGGTGDAAIRAGDAWSGTIYQAVSHAFAKAALFMAAGCVMQARAGDDLLFGLAGVALRLPTTTFALGLAAVTLIGLPPSGGFAGKWLLLSASLDSGQWWWAVTILAGSLLAVGYTFSMLGQSFHRIPDETRFQPVPRTMEAASVIAASAAIAIGLRGTEMVELLRIG